MMRTLQSRDSYLSVLSYRAGLYHNWHVFETRLLNAPLQKLFSKALPLKSRININTVKLSEVSQSCIWWNCQLVNDVLDSRYPSLVEYRIIYGVVAPIFEICLRDRCVSQIPVIKRCVPSTREDECTVSLLGGRSVACLVQIAQAVTSSTLLCFAAGCSSVMTQQTQFGSRIFLARNCAEAAMCAVQSLPRSTALNCASGSVRLQTHSISASLSKSSG